MLVCQGIGSQPPSRKVGASGWSQLLCGARTRPGSLPLPLPPVWGNRHPWGGAGLDMAGGTCFDTGDAFITTLCIMLLSGMRGLTPGLVATLQKRIVKIHLTTYTPDSLSNTSYKARNLQVLAEDLISTIHSSTIHSKHLRSGDAAHTALGPFFLRRLISLSFQPRWR